MSPLGICDMLLCSVLQRFFQNGSQVSGFEHDLNQWSSNVNIHAYLKPNKSIEMQTKEKSKLKMHLSKDMYNVYTQNLCTHFSKNIYKSDKPGAHYRGEQVPT